MEEREDHIIVGIFVESLASWHLSQLQYCCRLLAPEASLPTPRSREMHQVLTLNSQARNFNSQCYNTTMLKLYKIYIYDVASTNIIILTARLIKIQ